jgi:murein L,D-transpeptidase YcbB/YkuD
MRHGEIAMKTSIGRRYNMTLALFILLLLGGAWNQMQAAPMEGLPEYCHSTSASLSEEDHLLSTKIAQSISVLPMSDARLLGAFYGPCNEAPAWVWNGKVTPSALALLQVFRDVAERGLDADDYPVFLTPPRGSMDTTPDSIVVFTNFELQLSIGALHLARDLRCGRIDPSTLHADLPSSCEAFQSVEFVWNVSRSQNPSVEFDSLEPTAPGYLRTKTALRQYLSLARTPQMFLSPFRGTLHPGQASDKIVALRSALTRTGDLAGIKDASSPLYDDALVGAVRSFQVRHGLTSDGLLTAETYKQLAVPMQDRAAQLQLTLERWRWIQRSFAQPPIVVNIPEFRVRAYDSDLQVVLSMKVIVGGAYHRKTPVFENQISSVIFRPYWNIPTSIQRLEIAPAMRRDSKYLEKHGYEAVRGPGGGLRIRQRPGGQNALGLVKFSLPNVHDVYLHGTPAQTLFDRPRRDFSHGCIRVEDPASLAVWVLRENPDWTREKIEAAMHGSETLSVGVTHPVPVLIVYGTGFAAEDGAVYFLPDIYKEDAALFAALRTLTVRRQGEIRAITNAVRP